MIEDISWCGVRSVLKGFYKEYFYLLKGEIGSNYLSQFIFIYSNKIYTIPHVMSSLYYVQIFRWNQIFLLQPLNSSIQVLIIIILDLL